MKIGILSFVGACGTIVVACSSSSATTTPVTTPDADATAPASDDAGTDSAVAASGTCTTARTNLLLPVNKTSAADVSVVSDSGGTKLIYVDASAGGPQNAAKSARVYVNLGTGARVDVTDITAATSTDWDLAVRRDVIWTNSGDGGPGQGGAAIVKKTFDAVTSADADSAKLAKEVFFDADCNPQLDEVGAPATTFSSWYNYDLATNTPSPKDITYIVKGGTGTRYKVEIKSYSAAVDGGTGPTLGFFLFEVAAL